MRNSRPGSHVECVYDKMCLYVEYVYVCVVCMSNAEALLRKNPPSSSDIRHSHFSAAADE